ncbi:MAG TPA: S8 family serine peptidase [Casimicrobiaceae bacterium]|nr:S8 family serine peptidase [Casimicrobiaceae bacterium]
MTALRGRKIQRMKILLTSLALALGVMPVLASAETGRYIVKFTEGRSQGAVNALHAAGARVVLNLGPQNAVAAHIPEQALAGLSHNPNIEYIEEDVLRTPMALWNDTAPAGGGETTPYGVQMVQADKVISNNAAAKKICIIDSGYSEQHADLADGVGSTNVSGSGTWNKDSCGHGTHVAGTIAAIKGGGGVVGVNPGASLHIVKVFGNDALASGNCDWTYSSNLVGALNACTAAGASIVSMSLGGSFKSRTEENALKSASNNGVLSIAAAGNGGNKATSYPAGYASVMSVAAVDADENVASFSQQNRDVEIAGPGVLVLSTVPWLETNTLTSGKDTVSGGHVEFSGRGIVDGTLADGGQCTATNTAAWSGRVVLCQRGTNSFNEKVQNVQSSGGAAAVIYNNVASDATCGDFVGTLGAGNSSTIAAITVSCSDGATGLAHVGQTGTVNSSVTYAASGYEAWDGTSMATPHVSGVAALVWGCNPGASAAKVRTALTSTAKDKGAAGHDIAYGYGIVQARAATLSLGNTNRCTIVTP